MVIFHVESEFYILKYSVWIIIVSIWIMRIPYGLFHFHMDFQEIQMENALNLDGIFTWDVTQQCLL